MVGKQCEHPQLASISAVFHWLHTIGYPVHFGTRLAAIILIILAYSCWHVHFLLRDCVCVKNPAKSSGPWSVPIIFYLVLEIRTSSVCTIMYLWSVVWWSVRIWLVFQYPHDLFLSFAIYLCSILSSWVAFPHLGDPQAWVFRRWGVQPPWRRGVDDGKTLEFRTNQCISTHLDQLYLS